MSQIKKSIGRIKAIRAMTHLDSRLVDHCLLATSNVLFSRFRSVTHAFDPRRQSGNFTSESCSLIVLPARHDLHIQACNVQGHSVPRSPDAWGGLSSDERFQMTSQTLQIGQMTHRRSRSHSRKVSCATSRPEGGFAWSLTKSSTSLYLQTTTDTSVASRFAFNISFSVNSQQQQGLLSRLLHCAGFCRG